VFEWAPQLEVLHHADVVIHHGGISSVNESILAGVPMVVYPFTFLDQPGNAARVRFHGLGEVGDRSKESAAVIRERIIRVLSDRSYADSVTRMRAVFENYEVEGVLVAEVESLLQKRPSGPTPHDASPAE
jgi:UDP:flavonoid glycosyltransferase YjiC (YdhE family)